MQLGLFGHDDPAFDPRFPSLRRLELGQGAWLDHAPELLRGHASLLETLRTGITWKGQHRRMYERIVAVPRQHASVPQDGPGHPVLFELADALSERYGLSLQSITLALYRTGEDSVAWHRDKEVRDRPLGFVVTLSLGEPRPFMVRPVGGGPSRSWRLGSGDLMVMGGTCQEHFEHCVPKTRVAGPRLCVMFRERDAPEWTKSTPVALGSAS